MVVDEMKSKVKLNKHTVDFPTSTDFPGNYPGESRRAHFCAKSYSKNIQFAIVNEEDRMLEFDVLRIDAALANAMRRVLIAEVPTVAIEKVHMYNNTSIVQDEILAHRLGLLPLDVDPSALVDRGDKSDTRPASKDTIVFELQIKCRRNPSAKKDETDPKKMYLNSCVYSSDLKWVPVDDEQKAAFATRPPPAVIFPDILVAKMRPGHEIDLKCLCFRGIGRDHAKFSPVATATYRLMPEITLTREVTGKQAKRLKGLFPPGVISVEKAEDGVRRAAVADARLDTCSRQVLEDEELSSAVELTRVRDHFLFTVESASALKPHQLVISALQVLEMKCDEILQFMDSN